MERTLLVVTVKDEGPFLWEWVAYHRAIGFDDILVYENDSTDRTKRILRCLAEIGTIQYFPNPSPKRQWQNRAYRRASREPAFENAGWCMALDADEFLNIHVGDGTLADLTGAVGKADAVLVNWRMFGASGQQTLTDEPVTKRFTLSEPDDLIERSFIGVKTLFRTRAFARPGIHQAKAPRIEAPKFVNGSGLGPAEFLQKGWRAKDPRRRALAQVNHYKVRDAESFLVKSHRGSASHPDRSVDLEYWQKANANAVEERSIQRMLPRLEVEMARLDDAADGRLSVLTKNAITRYKRRVAALTENPETAAFLADLQARIASDRPAPETASAA